MSRAPSPCIGVCRFERAGPAGRHCIGCSMTKAQKRLAKAARKAGRREAAALVALVAAQAAGMGRYGHWREAYLARCRRKGAPVPKGVR